MSGKRDAKRRHIVVIRHAKSSWDDPSIADHDRPLSKRGRKALPRLHAHIATLGLGADVVMCSSSLRTRETLDGIRTALGRRARVVSDSALYEADGEQLLTELRRLDKDVNTAYLLGHNPGVADLVDVLAGDPASGKAVLDKFPTAAVAVLSIAVPWDALQPGTASLDSFWTPRQPR